MDPSSLIFNADEDNQDAEPGANAMPDSTQGRDSSSIQSPDFELPAASDPAADSTRSATATRTGASSDGAASDDTAQLGQN